MQRETLPLLDLNQRYTVEEAAQYLRQSRAQTFKQIKTEVIKTIPVGRRRYVPGSEIARLSSLS